MIDLVGGNIPEGKNFHITRRTGFSNRKFSIPLSWIIPREDKGEPCKKKEKKKNSGKNSLDTAESPELWLLLEQPSARGFECRVWIRFSCGSYQNRSHLRVFRRKKKKKRGRRKKTPFRDCRGKEGRKGGGYCLEGYVLFIRLFSSSIDVRIFIHA